MKSHPVWGAWIEMRMYEDFGRIWKSHPVWGAWIEIQKHTRKGL